MFVAISRGVVVLFVCCAGVFSISAESCAAARIHPVDDVRITSSRGWRVDPFGSGKMLFHHGWDYGVPTGTAVHATEKGRVYYAGWHKGYGWLVVIDHFNGYFTLYGHNSRLLVQGGQDVEAGMKVALAGSTGRSTGPHVHYEIRFWPGTYENSLPTDFAKQPADEDWIESWVESEGVGGE